MKVIITGPAYPYRGGIADTNEALCRALNRAGHRASLVTFTLQYPEFLFPGKTQYSTEPEPGDLEIKRMIHSINPLNWFASARKINKLNPDLVIFRYWIPFLSPALGTIAGLLHRKITKIALCDNVIPHEHHPGDKLLTAYFINKFDGFITLSHTVEKELALFSPKPVMYFPHPINDNLGNPVPKAEARKKLNLDPEGRYLLFFGLVRKYKGLDLLLKAMAEKPVKELGIKLMVAGEFYDDPEEYEAMIRDLGISQSVIITNRFIPLDEIKYYFSAADLVTQTYHTASQSGVTQMAYNFNCPILVTDVGGLSETVLHNRTGYVVNKQPDLIAKNIAAFFTENKADTFRENVIKEKAKYSWDAFTKKLSALYLSVSENKSTKK